MPNQPGAPAKTCTYCGCDCSKIKRLKDPHGRYYCGPCHEQHGPAPAPAASAPVAAAAAAAGPAEDIFDASLPAEQLDMLIGLEDASESVVQGPPRVCSNCGRMIGQAIICTSCGFNTKTGKTLTTAKTRTPKIRKCSQCSYSMAGLETPICPECGHVNRPEDRKDAMRAQSRAVVRREYTKPLIMLVAGLGVALAIHGGLGGGGVESLIYFMIKYAITVPLGVLAFFLCCIIWMGFDAPMHLTALRLAGVYAVVDAADAILSFLPMPFIWIRWAILLVLYIGLLADSLDLELVDAFLFALVTLLVRVAVVVAIVAVIISETGGGF